jgi:hypothetical protein
MTRSYCSFRWVWHSDRSRLLLHGRSRDAGRRPAGCRNRSRGGERRAAAQVLAEFFCTDHVAFTTTSGAPFAGITRSFSSFLQAALENADSRVYAGIHFRSACRDGVKVGRKIGKFTMQHVLKPLD